MVVMIIFFMDKGIRKLNNKKDIVDQSNLNITKQKWKDAFLTTPHGHPVKLIKQRGNYDN